MRRHTCGPAAVLALTMLGVTPAAAQTLALHDSPEPPRGSVLAAAYHVRLTSAWPQLPASGGCENGGSETLEGVLSRTPNGGYAGSLSRRTLLLFCGAHGAGGEACSLVLEGEGPVRVEGVLVSDERSPTGQTLWATWTPSAEHAAEVRGPCDREFKRRVRLMYLTARLGAEFGLPAAGAARRTERLEDYAWIVEVE